MYNFFLIADLSGREYIDTVIYIFEITRDILRHTYQCKSQSHACAKSYVTAEIYDPRSSRRAHVTSDVQQLLI